ncbi:MAG: GGDEF domain-containing protein [Pseudomonadales bacterium]|nr:GGDEF domain-containing protein [Pseudomonadales bacterium]
MNSLFRFLDGFVPEQFRSNPSDLTRCYILLGLIFCNSSMSIFCLLTLLGFLHLPEQNQILAVGMVAGCLIGYGTSFTVFKLTQNYRIASNLLVFTLALINFVAINITGGFYESPILQLFLLIPVTGFLLCGLGNGLFWLAITVLLTTLSYYMANFGIGARQLIVNPDDKKLLFTSMHFVLLIMVGGGLIIYELINESLKRKLNDERNRFQHRASHDSLTGLPNRFEFFRRLNQAAIACEDRNQKLAIVYIDLDGFKPVNDELGHAAGDELLCVIASRLKASLRLTDTSARIGGDEFALLLPGIKVPEDTEIIINKVLTAIKQPITIDDEEVIVHGSAGIAIFPDHSFDTDRLCRFADLAMYKAKEKHDCAVYFSPQMLDE